MMKRTVLRFMRSSGIFASLREANRRKILILTYHRFVQHEHGWATSATAFEEHLRYLTEYYSLVPLTRIHESLTNGAALPERAAAVTIDDGFRDAYDIAFPLLRKYSVPAALFVITDFVDGKAWLWTDKLRYITAQIPAGQTTIKFNEYKLSFEFDDVSSRLRAADEVNAILKKLSSEAKDAALKEIAASLNVDLPTLPPLEYGPVSWKQLKEMEEFGVEIGSHTVTHPILTTVDSEQLHRELKESRSRLETALGHRVTLFCYPNGSYDEHTRQAVADAGYRCAVTTKPILNGKVTDPLTLSRVPAENDMDHFVQTTCGFEELKSFLRASR